LECIAHGCTSRQTVAYFYGNYKVSPLAKVCYMFNQIIVAYMMYTFVHRENTFF